MFSFSKNYLSKHKILFLVLFYITGNNLLSQNINYSAGKISSDANKRLILEQSVKLNIDNIAISTEKLIIDQEKEIGFAKEISFKIEENNFWGEAEEFDFSKENVSFQNTKFSLCPCYEKIWWIEASEIKFSEDKESIEFKDAKLIVNNYTLGAWPSGSFPSSSKKRSGFLLPEINISNKSGVDISVPYYIAIKENLDTTLEPRYITKRGFGLSNEFRYLTNKLNGVLNSSILFNDNEYQYNYTENSFRWAIGVKHTQVLNKSSFLQIDYGNVSDAFFINDFGPDFSGVSKTLYTPQKLVVSSFTANTETKLLLNSFKIIDPIAANQYQELPKIEFSYFDSLKSFDFELESSFSIYRKGGAFRENSKERIKVLNLTPSFNFSHQGRVLFTEISGKIINSVFNFEGFTFNRTQPQLNFQLSTNLFRKNLINTGYLKPYLIIMYAPEKNQKNLPLINSGIYLDNINLNNSPLFSKNLLPKQKDIVFGFKNTIFSNSKKLFDLEVSKKISSVDGLKYSNAIFDLPEPIEINLRNYSLKNSILGFNFKIDEKSKFNTANLKFLQKYKSSSVKLDYFWAKNIASYLLNNSFEEKLNQIDAEYKFEFSKKYLMSAKFIYDIENSNLTNTILGMEYENPGLKLGFALIHSKELDWIKVINQSIFENYNQESFRIYFELKGLGSLGRPIENYLKRRTLN